MTARRADIAELMTTCVFCDESAELPEEVKAAIAAVCVRHPDADFKALARPLCEECAAKWRRKHAH